MSIPTNSNFDAANMLLPKHPLYMLFIDGLPEPLTTFRLDEAKVARRGYGLALYGLTGYGY